MQAGARVVLYMKLNTKSTNLCAELLLKQFFGKPWDAAAAQRDAGIAGNTTTIVGKRYIVLNATMLYACYHHDAVAGAISLSQIKNLFLDKEGFTLKFDGTNTVKTLMWKKVIHFAEELLIFGPLLNRRTSTLSETCLERCPVGT